jgi:NAD(P)-dependent dehydrogenase (short-subunit alcohol dehydrogenase family)
MIKKYNLAKQTAGAAFITGVSSGIGRALALQLMQNGYLVFGTVRKPADGVFLKNAGGIPLVLDVTDSKRIPQTLRRVQTLLGKAPLKFLINNAGLSTCVSWEDMSQAELRHQFDVNFFSAVEITQCFLPLLRAGRGRVVLMSSTSARLPNALMGAYCASKCALEAFAVTLRQELLPEGIPVICLQPGPVQTRIFQRTRDDLKTGHPEALRSGYYEKFLAFSRKLEQDGLTPETAARRIAALITSRHPPLRAVVARKAWFAYVLPWLPQRIFDAGTCRALLPDAPAAKRPPTKHP